MVGVADTKGHPAGRLTVVGLGPGDLERLPEASRHILTDPERHVVVRTLRHPAASQLAGLRSVETCDDLYEAASTFDAVYGAIVARLKERAAGGPVVYAVPGSPLVGELAVRRLQSELSGVEVLPAESFVDAILVKMGCDPLDRGLQILDGHALLSPLVLDKPTIIAHLDTPLVLADALARLGRALPEGAEATVLADLGTDDERVLRRPLDDIPPAWAGLRTSLFVDTEPAGLVGVVGVNRKLREECPWDRRQTHASLATHLVEETYELVEALAALGEEVDWTAYDAVEDELGDVLLQVLFHAAIATENGAFDIDDVATRLRHKLVRRHPHVFGDVEVADADEVEVNWERIKAEERAPAGPSLLDGVPEGLPALHRAAKLGRRAASVGFDWPEPAAVVEKLAEEVSELRRALGGDGDPAAELGDLLLTAVSLARHLEVDPEVELRRATGRFVTRFRAMEQEGPLDGLSPAQFHVRWEAAKRQT